MKIKNLGVFILILTMLLCLSGCGLVCSFSGHSWIKKTCTEPERCSRCGFVANSSPFGHDYSTNGKCTRCSFTDPDYISPDNIFSGKPTLNFYKAANGNISCKWKHKYTGDKTINYINVTYTTYDPVGTQINDHSIAMISQVRLIGPFKPNQDIDAYFKDIIFSVPCGKISFDYLDFEFSDGSTASTYYGWSNTVV